MFQMLFLLYQTFVKHVKDFAKASLHMSSKCTAFLITLKDIFTLLMYTVLNGGWRGGMIVSTEGFRALFLGGSYCHCCQMINNVPVKGWVVWPPTDFISAIHLIWYFKLQMFEMTCTPQHETQQHAIDMPSGEIIKQILWLLGKITVSAVNKVYLLSK